MKAIKIKILAQQGKWLKIHPAMSETDYRSESYKALQFIWIKRSELDAGKCESFNVNIGQ